VKLKDRGVVEYPKTALHSSSHASHNTCFVVFAKDDIRIRSVGSEGSEGFLDSFLSGTSRALPREPMQADSQSYSRDRPQTGHTNYSTVQSDPQQNCYLCTLNVVRQIEVSASVQPVFGVCRGRVCVTRGVPGVFAVQENMKISQAAGFPHRSRPTRPICPI
jgi:hypothetical protein